MAVLFISHSSKDDALVDALTAWLRDNGFTDVFVDHQDIAGGAKWADALRASAGACRVVMCVVTDNWLASAECFGEFSAAWYMGKRILPMFLTSDPGAAAGEAAARWRRVRAEDQGIDLAPLRSEAGLDFARDETVAAQLRDALKAAGALTRVGLDPEAFAIDRNLRPTPFPGLASFDDEDADAALFYGRSKEIAAVLERLRAVRATGDRQPLMILGASGSGKSSLLKAGVIPRLRREAPAWIPLRAFRPGADPLFNFAEAIARTLADFKRTEASGAIRRALESAWRTARREAGAPTAEGWRALATILDGFGAKLRAAAARPDATLLISIDQAEEIARAEGESGEALADYLRATLLAEAAADWRLAFTIRTDSFPELQRHPRFHDLDSFGYDLRALPVFRFNDVVEAPARRYCVEIDADLIDALMEDAPKSDALPLLAFGMQRLWRRFADAGAIRAQDYRDLGGMSGLIEDAAERALRGVSPDEDRALPNTPPPPAALKLAAETFVPPLAQINDDGEAIRRVATWSEFSADAQALLERFDQWRLVVRKGGDAEKRGADNGAAGDTVEVAHEALFREWTRLADWLEPERARLDALRGLNVAAAQWAREGRRAVLLTHFGTRLIEAEELLALPRYAARLDPADRDYVAACAAAERGARRRRTVLQATAAALGLGVVLGSLGFAFQFEIGREWTRWTQVRPFVMATADLEKLAPGKNFRECAAEFACPEMVVLPGGTFTMGAPAEEPDSFDDERPQREVTIPRIAVGKFEITQEQWAACVANTKQADLPLEDDAPRVGCAPIGDSGFGRGDRPANNVSWHDAQGYVAWWNAMISGDPEGPYRLLSEAEWEYAARGETTTAYFWGNEIEGVCAHANLMNPETKQKYPNLRGDAVACETNNYVESSPAGSFRPNAFGLYDMAGNVWEWMEDCWHPSYEGAPVDGSAWKDAGGGDCSLAVLRGGSWVSGPRYLRSANRVRFQRPNRLDSIGFRLSRTLVD